MSFRNRTTRFSAKQPTDSISVISQVVAPTISQQRTVTRATRFTPTPTPRPTPTPTPTPRPTQIVRTTRFTPQPRPRDDFQRSLSVFPVREAFADSVPREIPQKQIISQQREPSVTRRVTRFTPVRTTPKRVRIDEKSSFMVAPPRTPTREEELFARQDPSSFLTIGQQRQAGVGVAPPLSRDKTTAQVFGEIEKVTKGVSAVTRERIEEEILVPRGIDPRSPVGEVAGGFAELSIGFTEEVFAQGTSLLNLGSFIGEEVKRRGVFGEAELVAPRRDLFVAPTVSAEFTGGLIEGVIQGGDPLALARERAEARLAGQTQIRSIGQIGGFALPLVLGGASLIGATVKAPRAFLPQATTSLLGTPAVETTQIARGITIFGRPIVSRVAGEGGGFTLGAPKGVQLSGAVERLGSTPRFAEGVAEGGKFQQKVNREVLEELLIKGKISPADVQSFDDFARISKLANATPVNIVRGFGSMPIEHVKSGKETKALINYFRTNPELQVKGSFAQIPQIRKAGLRQAGDIDIDLSKFPDNIALSGVKAKELVGVLNSASQGSGRKFFAGTGKQTGKVFVKDNKGKNNKVAEFLNDLDGEEAIKGKTDIVFGVKGTTKGVDVEGVNITKLTQQFKRKTASVFSFQQKGTKGVPDAPSGVEFRLGAPKGRFEKDIVDLYQIGKTQVANLRGLNRVDNFKLNLKIRGNSKAKIDKFDDTVEGLRKRFPEVNFDKKPSRAVKEVLDFSRSNPLKSLGSKSLKSSGKGFKSVSGSGSFSRELNSIFSNPSFKVKPSKVSPSISGRASPSIFSPSGVSPSGVSPSGFGSGSIFDPFPSSPSPSGASPSGSFPSGSFPTPPQSPPAVSSITGADPSGLFFLPQGQIRRPRRRLRKGRGSRLGGRLFDIADEPFGKVAVGLGFFVETQRGESSIDEALGLPDEPLTRQERQARARLGRSGGRSQENFAEGFDFGGFFG